MNIYKIVIDNEHSYKIKGDGINRFGDDMIAEIYRKDGDDCFTTIAQINLTNIIGIFLFYEGEDLGIFYEGEENGS